MLLDWFDTREITAYAGTVVAEVNSLAEAAESESGSEKKRTRALKDVAERYERLVGEVRLYAKQNPLNIYKKAKFLNAVKWKLREAGRDDDFVEKLVSLLAVALNG